MCGIFCCISQKHSQVLCAKQLLKNRGPDAYNEAACQLNNYWHGFFSGSTLWTQGSGVTSQPLVHPDGHILLWNGDKYVVTPESGETSLENDSEEILSCLIDSDLNYFENLIGPYSFIFYHAKKNEIWFGRDVFGRHSLLWQISSESIVLSSVTDPKSVPTLSEVPSCGIFKISLISLDIGVDLYPWTHMIPKEITIAAPLNVKNLICHSVLGRCTDYFWTIMDPPPILTELNCDDQDNIFPKLLQISSYSNNIHNLKKLLFKSVERRIMTKPNFCKNCLLKNDDCQHAKISILFSGGLDSAILALVSNYFVSKDEPIDLLNVSFSRNNENRFGNVPDRKTGLNTLKELKLLCPERCWNFVEINITQEELKNEKQNHIFKLIYPLNSILDDSLGCAIWFAARGTGMLNDLPYSSPSRVVLLGMGADEMFGGYSRHRVTFKNSGWKGLARDLFRDLRLIGERNLGRDNRVVADHGRQPRMPYLDEEFVAFVDSLPTWSRCCPHPQLARGIGDKLLLRLLAWHLGLRSAASLPKKALQFGSHIANPKDKGHLTSKDLIT